MGVVRFRVYSQIYYQGYLDKYTSKGLVEPHRSYIYDNTAKRVVAYPHYVATACVKSWQIF